MLNRFFRLSENNTTVRTELLAGLTTFLTMAYIIVVQPLVLSGRMFDIQTGMDFGAVTTATCIAAALASAIMGIYGRYPIAQAPGMGENFFFVLSMLPAAAAMIAAQVKTGQIAAGSTTPWQIGLGVVFYSGLLFLLLSMLGVREKLMEAISPSMRNGIAIGIGLFIVLIGLDSTGLLRKDPGTGWTLNPQFASPDRIVFFFGLLVTAALHARRVRGSIVWGIFAATLFAVALKLGLPCLGERVMGCAAGERLDADDAVHVGRSGHVGPAVDRADALQTGPCGRAGVADGAVYLDLPVHGAVRHAGHVDRRGRAGGADPRQSPAAGPAGPDVRRHRHRQRGRAGHQHRDQFYRERGGRGARRTDRPDGGRVRRCCFSWRCSSARSST